MQSTYMYKQKFAILDTESASLYITFMHPFTKQTPFSAKNFQFKHGTFAFQL